jgi:hypothetical protein
VAGHAVDRLLVAAEARGPRASSSSPARAQHALTDSALSTTAPSKLSGYARAPLAELRVIGSPRRATRPGRRPAPRPLVSGEAQQPPQRAAYAPLPSS